MGEYDGQNHIKNVLQGKETDQFITHYIGHTPKYSIGDVTYEIKDQPQQELNVDWNREQEAHFTVPVPPTPFTEPAGEGHDGGDDAR